MKKTLLTSILFSTFILASSAPQTACTFMQKGVPTVNWKAYKTPLKVGVGGTFEKIDLTLPQSKMHDLKALFTDATMSIDETSINSKNKGRDAKLVKFFFGKMQGEKINVKVTALTEDPKTPSTGTITTEITMNGITKSVPMRYTYENDTLQTTGTIDLFDFQASSALQGLNKACFELHKGKTWNDVTVTFQMGITRTCSRPKE